MLPWIVRSCMEKYRQGDQTWISMGDTVYDLTSIQSKHPGGNAPILKSYHEGTVQSSFRFHSRSAQAIWKANRIGRLVESPTCTGCLACGGETVVKRYPEETTCAVQ